MNDDELTTAVKSSLEDVRMNIPTEQIVIRSRAIRARRWVPGLAVATAGWPPRRLPRARCCLAIRPALSPASN
jgi:hypothetical protein